MKHEEMGSSANHALWYRDAPFSADELMGWKNEITKECWRYLAGVFCKREHKKCTDSKEVRVLYNQLEIVFGCTDGNIRRIMHYSTGIDLIQKYLPDTAAEIMNGNISLHTHDVITMGKLTPHNINQIEKRLLSQDSAVAVALIAEFQKMPRKHPRRGRPRIYPPKVIPRYDIKNTPIPDPDAQLNALSFTIPTWVNMIERAFDKSEWSAVSEAARKKIFAELDKLSKTIEALTVILEEATP